MGRKSKNKKHNRRPIQMNLNVFLAGVVAGFALAAMEVMYYAKLPWWVLLSVIPPTLFVVLYNLQVKGIQIGKVK